MKQFGVKGVNKNANHKYSVKTHINIMNTHAITLKEIVKDQKSNDESVNNNEVAPLYVSKKDVRQ